MIKDVLKGYHIDATYYMLKGYHIDATYYMLKDII